MFQSLFFWKYLKSQLTEKLLHKLDYVSILVFLEVS